MAGRGRDLLTGGTRDVNGQLFKMTVSQTAANTNTEGEFPIPIQRLQGANGRSQVMEILKFYVSRGVIEAQAAVGEVQKRVSQSVTTKSFGTSTVSVVEPSALLYCNFKNTGAFTAGGTYSDSLADPLVVDMTDGAGHGILVATDSLFMQVSSVNQDAAQTSTVWILYRWKNVGLAEYIGIVQSQS